MKVFARCFCLLGLLVFGVAQAQTVTKGQPTTFRAKTSGAQTFEWTFPGGIVINGEVVQYTFSQSGPQEVKLRVVGIGGEENEVSKRVLVANKDRPTAVIEALLDGQEILGERLEATAGQAIALRSNSFFGEKNDDDFTKIWTINGRTFAESDINGAFNTVGNYLVGLTVIDQVSQNLRDQDTLQVSVGNQGPRVVSLTFNEIESLPGQVQLKAEVEDDDGTISSYKFEALESGRTVIAQVVNGDTTTFDLSRFPGVHEYNFRVTATDDRFDTDTLSTTETFRFDSEGNNTAPEATMSLIPGNQGDTDTRFKLIADAIDGDGDVLQYEWIFSSGERFFTPQLDWRFPKPGTYDITLNVSDGIDRVSDKQTISIVEVIAPESQNTAPTAEIFGVLPSETGGTNTVFQLYLEAEDEDLDQLSYVWDLGNGNKSFTKNTAVIYREPGTYTVQVEVSDGLETVSDQIDLVVEADPDAQPFETLEERIARLKQEALDAETQAAETVALAKEGTLNERFQTKIDAIGPELKGLVDKAESDSEVAKAEAKGRLENYRTDMNAAIGLLEAARRLDKTLEQAAEDLKKELADSKEKAKALRESGRTDLADRFDNQQQALSEALQILEEGRAGQETFDQVAERLKTRADTAKTDSQAFREAAQAVQAEKLVNRKQFLSTQIEELEALRLQPLELPPLGITGNGQESLEQRLSRFNAQAESSAVEAKARRDAAKALAAEQQVIQAANLEALQAQLRTEQDDDKREILANRAANTQAEIERLVALQNPQNQLTPEEIKARTAKLTANVEDLRQAALLEQESYVSGRLAEIQAQIDVTSDAENSRRLQAEKERLEAQLERDQITSSYREQLLQSRKELNLRLANSSNSTTELLIDTQLESIETKLQTLESLGEAEQEVNEFDEVARQNPEQIVDDFLAQERQRLEAQVQQLKAELAVEKDTFSRKALAVEIKESERSLSSLPTITTNEIALEDLALVKAKAYLENFKNYQLEIQNEGSGTDEAVAQARISALDKQIQTLQRLDRSGYDGQTTLAALMLDLDNKEAELLKAYRAEPDPIAAEALRGKLITLGEAKTQLEGLKDYGINTRDTVFEASEKLAGARGILTSAYLEAERSVDKIVATEGLQTLQDRRVWLERFYDPDRLELTLGQVEAQLRSANTVQSTDDLNLIAGAKINLRKAIEVQVLNDFENFKMSLQDEVRSINDPEEKAAMQARIDALSYDDFAATVTPGNLGFFESLLADVSISTRTSLFLYATVPLTSTPQPLLFEWDMGDGRTHVGQNINHEYYESGFYRVVLTISDGVTSRQDLLTIKVID